MNNENLILSNNSALCSELNEDDVSLTAKFIICDFQINKNGVKLNRLTAENWIYTLVSQPVVGKIGITDNGTADFTQHNLHPTIRLGNDGQIYADQEFDSSACGVFTSVQIETLNGKEYITATAKIWKRFSNFCAIIQKRLIDSTIATSWEIATKKFHTELQNGKQIKVIDDGVFLGHCLLASHISPAYNDSCLLEVASENNQTELIEALNKDILEVSNINMKKEDENLSKENINPIVDSSTEKQNTDISMLTEWDLKKALRQAISEKLDKDKWDIDIIMHSPTEKTVWVKLWGDASELDVTVLTYTVENDIVTVSEPSEGKLTISISQINSTIENLNSEIEMKNEAIIKANETIQTLNTDISTLTVYKEKFDNAEQERITSELAAKQAELKTYALKGGYITSEEIDASEEIKGFIENLNKKEIQAIIADRLVSSLTTKKEAKSIETSNVDKKPMVEKLNIASSDEVADYKFVMKTFLRK